MKRLGYKYLLFYRIICLAFCVGQTSNFIKLLAKYKLNSKKLNLNKLKKHLNYIIIYDILTIDLFKYYIP